MSIIGIIALPMTYVILTAGIDLSVGSILALATAVVALIITRGDSGNVLWRVAIAVGAAIGASGITSKAASRGHFKTGQFDRLGQP